QEAPELELRARRVDQRAGPGRVLERGPRRAGLAGGVHDLRVRGAERGARRAGLVELLEAPPGGGELVRAGLDPGPPDDRGLEPRRALERLVEVGARGVELARGQARRAAHREPPRELRQLLGLAEPRERLRGPALRELDPRARRAGAQAPRP